MAKAKTKALKGKIENVAKEGERPVYKATVHHAKGTSVSHGATRDSALGRATKE